VTERADVLLAGPRGRRLCALLLADADGQVADGRSWWRLFDAPTDRSRVAADVAAAVAATDPAAVGLGRRLDDALGTAVSFAQYWQEPDGVDDALADDEIAALLRPVAEAVAAAPDAQWWWSPAPPADQVAVVWAELLSNGTGARDRPDERAPLLTGAAARLRAWQQTGPMSWWSGPSHARLPTTTRTVPFHPADPGPARPVPAGLWLVEDTLGWTTARTWPVTAPPGARVHEVAGADDWTALAARFPLPVGRAAGGEWSRHTGRRARWVVPDYAAVAAEFDAVHLTVAGWLSIAGRPLPVPGTDASTYLAGWGPDVTWWLADVLRLAGTPTDWVDAEGDWHPV
jgi:hypothetical protein